MFGFGKKPAKPAGVQLPDLPSFDDLISSGAYRRFGSSQVDWANGLVADAFPGLANRIACFGYDWLGRIFATDSERGGGVLLLEPGTGEALEIPVTEAEFHDDELVDNAEAAIAWSFYRDWRAGGGAQPGDGQCIGYAKPLLVGGSDSIDNLELSDLDVYWSICGQLLSRLRGG